MLDSVSSCTASRSLGARPAGCDNGCDGGAPCAASPATPARAPTHVIGDAPTIATLERVRVSAATASLSFVVSAPPTAQPAQAVTASTDDPVTATPDAPASGASAIAGDAPLQSADATAFGAVASMVHVVVNATRYVASSRSLAPSAATPPSDAAASSTNAAAADPAAVDASGAASVPASPDAITRLSLGDFESLRLRSTAWSSASSFSLTLTTQEGDVVELDVRQLVQSSKARLLGTIASGDRVDASAQSDSLDRSVAMQVKGDLSDDERAAIDALLTDVVGVANEFFGGDARAALDHLSSLDFDPAQLSRLSLEMSQTRAAVVSRAYLGDGANARLTSPRSDGRQALVRLGHAHRRLIDTAQRHFDDASAATLVREMLARLLDVRGSSKAGSDAAPTVSDPTQSDAAVATTA